MYHKKIKLASTPSVKVRVHSIDGRTWTLGSPRQAASVQLAFIHRRKAEYNECKLCFVRNVDDKD